MFSKLTPNLKRGAIVAVFSLTILGVSALPAQATGTPVNLIASATSITTPGTTATQLAGVANSVTISNTVISGPSAVPVYFTVSGGVTTTSTTSGTILAGASVGIATTVAGTITVTGYPIVNGAASATATDVKTITVVGSVPGTVYATSQIYGAVGTAVMPSAATDAAFSLTVASTSTNVAQFSVSELDSNGIAVFGASAKPIIVTVSAGFISSYDVTSPTPILNTTFISATPTTPTSHFLLSGMPGVAANALVSFIINGYSKVYKVTFVGSAAKIVLTPINSVVGVGLASALPPSSAKATGITANTNAFKIQEFDGIGNLLAPNPALISITSATPGIATGGAIDNAGIYPLGNIAGGTPTTSTLLGLSVNGVAPGTTTLMATDASTGVSSQPVSIRVSSGIPTSVVLTTDFKSYVSGDPGILITTLSDAAGTLPAGTYAVFTGQATASIVLTAGTATLPGAPATVASSAGSIPVVVGQVTVKGDGTYTSTFSAPASAGTIFINATAAASNILVTPATFTVVTGNSAPEADAEAANADNASTDAGALITVAADKADAAAQAAGVRAAATSAALAALTRQITALLAKVVVLAALIAKILKKK